MSTSCVVCKGSSQCQRCQIKDLKKIIEKQEYELQYLRKGSNHQLKLNNDYSQYFETDNKFLPIKYYGEMKDYQFLTITFDPNKFGIFNQPSDEQNYIFCYLKRAIMTSIAPKPSFITQLTGCFEYQKNGTTHAHIIIKSDYTTKQVEDFFRPFFTDDPKNKYAIKSYLLQKEKCETYLQKESTEFFRYDKHFNDLEDAEAFDDCKSKCIATIEDVLNIIKQREAFQRVENSKLFNRLLKAYKLPQQSLYTINNNTA